MTIHIPVKLLLFVLYTVAILGGAFGISYAVFQWREDDGGLAADVERMSNDMDLLMNTVGDHYGEARHCHGAQNEAIALAMKAIGGTAEDKAEAVVRWIVVRDVIGAYC